jgi:hypothetical protein
MPYCPFFMYQFLIRSDYRMFQALILSFFLCSKILDKSVIIGGRVKRRSSAFAISDSLIPFRCRPDVLRFFGNSPLFRVERINPHSFSYSVICSSIVFCQLSYVIRITLAKTAPKSITVLPS